MGRWFVILFLFGLLFLGCGDKHSGYDGEGANIGAFYLNLKENTYWTEDERKVMVLSANIISDIFTREFGRVTRPFTLDVYVGETVPCAGGRVSGCYNHLHNVVKAPANRNSREGLYLLILYHELWHVNAPQSEGYDSSHTYFDWSLIDNASIRAEIIAEIELRRQQQGI